MPLTDFHSARVKSLRVLPGKKEELKVKRIAKGVTKRENRVISLSELADTLRDKLGDAI